MRDDLSVRVSLINSGIHSPHSTILLLLLLSLSFLLILASNLKGNKMTLNIGLKRNRRVYRFDSTIIIMHRESINKDWTSVSTTYSGLSVWFLKWASLGRVITYKMSHISHSQSWGILMIMSVIQNIPLFLVHIITIPRAEKWDNAITG